MVLPDDDPVKWELKEHTKVKHELLVKYLQPWIYHLAKHGKVVIWDCFAGRGEYEDGSHGSPLLILKRISEYSGKYDEAICIFIEKNENNFRNLELLIDKELKNSAKYSKIKVFLHNDEFSNVVSGILEKTDKLAPSLFFIDPFGFAGVPFEVIRKIMERPYAEIFLTFMSRPLSRFICDETKYSALDELFGTSKWRKLIEIPEEKDRQHELRELYRQRLKEIGVKYSLAYKVSMDEIRQTEYYLIHATNHFDGFKIMKDIMYGQSPVEGRFAYLGPDEYQGDLSAFLAGKLDDFKTFLLDRFKGRKISFWNVMKESYSETSFNIEKHYRQALRELEETDIVEIKRRPLLNKRGKERTAIDGKAIIIFPG